jgi:pyranose oxidase
MRTREVDILVIGAGPAGSTYARILAENGRKVTMLDMGPQYSKIPGENLKNSFPLQRNMGNFSNFIRGLLHPISIPASGGARSFLDPITYQPDRPFIRNGINPRQDPRKNLDNACAAYSVGGMLLHWTAAVPRQHPTVERADFLPPDEWNDLYQYAEALLNKHSNVYENSIRNTVVKEALSDYYKDSLPAEYGVQNLPMGAERSTTNPEFVRFTGTDNILKPVLDSENGTNIELLSQHRARRLVRNGSRVVEVIVNDLQANETISFRPNIVIVTCGTVMSAQLLWASEIRPSALGRYIIEHPIAFCQVVLSREIVKKMETDPRFEEARKRKHPLDPLPLPMDDPAPNIWIPVSDDRPWHCQITKDAFHYGDLPGNVDDRLIVDLRWFAAIDPRKENRVTFEEDISNEFGMPQPTFEFEFGEDDRKRMHDMMDDMLRASQSLGGFLSGSEPRFMPWGLCLHIQGACRMGVRDDGTSVVDTNSKVWGLDNLFIGGNSVIPTRNACNPTLTNVALASRSARAIIGVLDTEES